MPGSAVIVNVKAPSTIAGGDQPMRNRGLPEQGVRHREYGKGDDEEADTTIGENGTGQHHRHDRTLLSQPPGDRVGNGKRRAAVIHQFTEDAAKQEKRGRN